MRLKDRTAIVTGAASGIGLATALKFGAEGALVMCADMNGDGAQRTAARIADLGGQAASFKADVTKEAEVQALVAETVKQWDRVDVMFNNAGIEFGIPGGIEALHCRWGKRPEARGQQLLEDLAAALLPAYARAVKSYRLTPAGRSEAARLAGSLASATVEVRRSGANPERSTLGDAMARAVPRLTLWEALDQLASRGHVELDGAPRAARLPPILVQSGGCRRRRALRGPGRGSRGFSPVAIGSPSPPRRRGAGRARSPCAAARP